MRVIIISVIAGLCAACAGRDPMPVATVQPQDTVATCAMITAEIQLTTLRFKS